MAEVSKIDNYRQGELLCMDGRANPLMDRRELRSLEWLQWLPHPQLLNVVWCGVVVVVVVVEV